MTQQTRYHATLTPEQARQLDAIAAGTVLSASEHMRLAAIDYIRRYHATQTVARTTPTNKDQR